VVAAVLVAGSEKAAAHRLGLSHSTIKHHLANARSKVGAETTAQLVWILAPRLPEPEGVAQTAGFTLGSGPDRRTASRYPTQRQRRPGSAKAMRLARFGSERTVLLCWLPAVRD